MMSNATTQQQSVKAGLSSGELLALCQSFNPGQDLDLARAVQDAVLSRLKKQGHAGNEWADMATNGMQWVRNIQDGISTPEEALKGLESDLAHCRAVQAKADAPTMQVDASNLAALEGPSPHSEGVDERAAWVADMVAAGAKHLGGECWEWDVDDFEFRLWKIARGRRPQQVRPRAKDGLEGCRAQKNAQDAATMGPGGAAKGRLDAVRQSPKRPTPAQLTRLRQVMAGHITRWGESWVSGLYNCRASMGGNPTYVMMCKLQEAGWIDDKCIERQEGRMGSWQIVLTEAGRAVLAR